MPSFYNPFAGLSCRKSCAIDTMVEHREQEILNAFAGRPSIASSIHDATKVQCDNIVTSLPISTTTTQPSSAIMYQQKNKNSSMKNDYSTRSGSSRSILMKESRRTSFRSAMSRADSYKSTNSGISVRSSPWYMKQISPSILFWNGDSSSNHSVTSHTNMDDSNSRCGGGDGIDRHHHSTVPIQEDTEDEVTTEDCDNDKVVDEEEEDVDEYIFCDSSDSSDAIEHVMTKTAVDDIQQNDCTPIEEEEEIESFQISSLLGPTIIRRTIGEQEESSLMVNPTDTTLQNSALVGLYYAKAHECQQTTEYVNLFTAGYYHSSLDSDDGRSNDDHMEKSKKNEMQALSIVFCNADADDDENCDEIVVPNNFPYSWYTLPRSEHTKEIQRRIRSEFDIVTTAGPTLVIFDPISGRIICSNAILDILDLDRSDFDQYDAEACQLYDSWLQQLLPTTARDDDETTTSSSDCSSIVRYEQMDVGVNDEGLVMIEYMDGERTSYERSLPYSI